MIHNLKQYDNNTNCFFSTQITKVLIKSKYAQLKVEIHDNAIHNAQ